MSQYVNFDCLHPKFGGRQTLLDKKPLNSLLSEGLFSSIEIKKYVSPVLPGAVIEQR